MELVFMDRKEAKSLIDKLINGEDVKCLKCSIGLYTPLNPYAETNHYYVCDKCKDTVHFDPVVDIE